jgi:hypothetical protein
VGITVVGTSIGQMYVEAFRDMLGGDSVKSWKILMGYAGTPPPIYQRANDCDFGRTYPPDNQWWYIVEAAKDRTILKNWTHHFE